MFYHFLLLDVPTKPQPATNAVAAAIEPQLATTAVAAASKPQPATTAVAAASKPGQIKGEGKGKGASEAALKS